MNKKQYITAAFIVIVFFCGFLAGRATVKEKKVVRYVQGETQIRTVKVPEPQTVYVPRAYFLPVKTDTITKIKSVDTSQIILDYVSEKKYSMMLFNDNNGRLELQPTLQYNSITDLQYSYTPVLKEVTIRKEQAFTPFLGASWSTFNFVGAGGGVFIKNVGVEYQYLYNYRLKESGHLVGLKVKF